MRPVPQAQAAKASPTRASWRRPKRLDWSQPADELARKVRAFNPWPMAEAVVAGERLRIHAPCRCR
jgi:methionyl-tRNA formyltransferase